MENYNPLEIIKNFRAQSRCPNCGSEYKSENIKILGHFDVMFIAHLFCSKCKNPALATILLVPTQNGREVSAKIIDNIQDISENTVTQKIATDDLIEFHRFLKDFNGDFKNAIKM